MQFLKLFINDFSVIKFLPHNGHYGRFSIYFYLFIFCFLSIWQFLDFLIIIYFLAVIYLFFFYFSDCVCAAQFVARGWPCDGAQWAWQSCALSPPISDTCLDLFDVFIFVKNFWFIFWKIIKQNLPNFLVCLKCLSNSWVLTSFSHVMVGFFFWFSFLWLGYVCVLFCPAIF